MHDARFSGDEVFHDWTDTYLRSTVSAFILLWLAAMQYLPFFDSAVLFILVTCIHLGMERGAGKEFLGLLRLLLVFPVSLYGYPMLQDMTDFNFGISNPLWVEVGWFLTLLVGSWLFLWIMIFLLDNPGDNWIKSRFWDKLVGILLGGAKGVAGVYILAMTILSSGVYCHFQMAGEQFLFSYTYCFVKVANEYYPVGEVVDKKNLLGRVQEWCDKALIQKVGTSTFADSPANQKKIADFLTWLQQQPSRLPRLTHSPEMQKTLSELWQIEDVKPILTHDADSKRLRQQKCLSLAQLCQLLLKTTVVGLSANNKIKDWFSAVNLSQIQGEVEQNK